MPPTPKPLNLDRYNELHSQGLSQRQIAKEMGIPEGTLRHQILRNKAGLPKGDVGIPSEGKLISDIGIPKTGLIGIPNSDISIPFQEIIESWPIIQEMVKWWDARKISNQTQKKLERATYHISPKWIEAIKREADLSGETYAAVVNRAFQKYFSGS